MAHREFTTVTHLPLKESGCELVNGGLLLPEHPDPVTTPAWVKGVTLYLLEQVTYSTSFHERPSRVIMATEATGPQVPD